MVAEADAVAIEEQSGEEKKLPSFWTCSYCAEEGFTTPLLKFNHERTYHHEQWEDAKTNPPPKDTPRERPAPTGAREPVVVEDVPQRKSVAGVSMQSVTEVTKRFAEALDSAAPQMGESKKRQAILAFDERPREYTGSINALERFLSQCGLTISQAEFVKMVMMGSEPQNQSPWGQPTDGQPQGYTYNPMTGQMMPMPIFMMNQQQPNPNSAAGSPYPPPMYFPMPTPGNQEQLTRRDVEDIVDRIAERLKPAPVEQKPPTTPMRRYQQAVEGPDGQMFMGWVEEPLNPLSDTINLLQSVGLVGQKETPAPATVEDIGKAVLEKVQPLIKEAEESRPNPELTELKKEFGEFMHRSELKEAEIEAAKTAAGEVMKVVQPQLDELKDLRSRTGLTDHQATLHHEESIQGNILTSVNTSLSGLRDDIRPLMVNMLISSMKAQGLSDTTIGDIVSRMTPAPSTDGPDVRASMMRKWVNT